MKLYLSLLSILTFLSLEAFSATATFTCDSSPSPIHGPKGDQVVITAKNFPVEVLPSPTFHGVTW